MEEHLLKEEHELDCNAFIQLEVSGGNDDRHASAPHYVLQTIAICHDVAGPNSRREVGGSGGRLDHAALLRAERKG